VFGLMDVQAERRMIVIWDPILSRVAEDDM
jgi:hypothetical protein